MTRHVLPLILATGLMFSPAAAAHPDLMAQIERLDQQLQAEPDNVELLLRRGDLHRRHQDYAAAIRDFAAARVLAADCAQLDFLEGRLALELGDYRTAATLLDRYLTLHPNDAVGWRLRGESALGLGEPSAPADFQRAIDTSQAPSPDLYRQWILALVANQDATGALDAVDAGLARFGPEVTLLGLGTDLALAQGDKQRAQAYLDRLPAGLERLAPWSGRQRALSDPARAP